MLAVKTAFFCSFFRRDTWEILSLNWLRCSSRRVNSSTIGLRSFIFESLRVGEPKNNKNKMKAQIIMEQNKRNMSCA